MAEQDTPPPTITAMKIPIIKKGEYDIWSMRMRQYICHTDHNLWDIIVNGGLQEEAAPPGEQSCPQERVKSILLLAIPDEYLLKFHNVPDDKSLWDVIKSRFRGNDESKEMHKNVLKHQFENFTTAPNESLDKAYDRFQKLISQLEVYAAPVSKEDINQKFLRSLPPSWSQIALIMRNKPDIDQTDIDDLYNNLIVYEDDMKRSLSSTSNSQNLAFLSSENTSSTNEVSPASGNFGVNTAGGTSSSSQVSSTPGADEVVCSFFAQQTTSPPLDNEDLQQIDQDDLEELDIRWQVAMLTVRVQRFIQKTGRNLDFKGKQPVTFDKSKVKCYNCHRKGHFAKECKSGRNQGKRSYGDNGRRNATTNEPSSQALVAQDGLGGYDWSNDFDEPVNYALMAISSSSSSVNKLKVKIEKWEESSKNLNKLLNSQMSAKDKNGLGYGTQLDEISNKSKTDSEISMSVIEVRSSDEEITPANDRFPKADGYHAVPPPITRNFLTPRADISFAGLDVYAIRKKIIKSKTTEPKDNTSESKTSETVGKTNEVEKSKPKINRDKVIIEDWNSDDVSEVNTVNPVKINETQTVKTQVDKIGQISQKEGIGFKKIKACFVYKSTDHLIKDCLINPVRSNGKRAVHTVSTTRPFAPKIAQTGSAIRPIYPRMDNGNPEICLQDHAVVDSGCSSHMTGNKAYLLDYEDYNGGFVAFGSDPKGDELKFNLFSVSQMCDKKNSVLFTDIECLILSPSFKLLDKSQVVLRAPRQNGVYSLDLKNIVPSEEITNEELREFSSEYYIPFALHPVVPAASASIADFPEGKVGVNCGAPRLDCQTSVGSSEDADVAGAESEAGEVDSGLKCKRPTSDVGAGTSKRVHHVSLGVSTSIEEETPDAPPTLAAKESPPQISPLTADDLSRRDRETGPKAFEGMPQSVQKDEEICAEDTVGDAQVEKSARILAITRQVYQLGCEVFGGGVKPFCGLDEFRQSVWLISHGLRLAAMSALESQEVKQSFGDVVKCALARGKAEAVEELHEKKLLTVPAAQVPGYNDKAYEELVAAMEAMKLLELLYCTDEVDPGLPHSCDNGGVPIFARPRDILNPFALEKEIPLKESLEAHAIRLAKKKGVKGKAILCDRELLGKLKEAGDAAYQVGSSEKSRCHNI
ncbi:ribonuclease H-like domain-containing protein [Tanacetum coccineum]|uniref:Ribonuclease H-like domain-containing protein n=1 Tax=Tanacetum coccineum TaxID=301880 RepID=A0ABQ4WB02_9ASTR